MLPPGFADKPGPGQGHEPGVGGEKTTGGVLGTLRALETPAAGPAPPAPAAGTGGGAQAASPLQVSQGRVEPTSLYQNLVARFAGSKLVGYVPPDGAKYGITTGSAEEYARLAVALAKQESSFKTVESETGKGGRVVGQAGLFQFSAKDLKARGLGADISDPDKQITAMIGEFEKIKDAGGIATQHGKTWGGAAAYFGPFRRPEKEVIAHLPEATRIASRAGDTQVAGPGVPRESDTGGGFTKEGIQRAISGGGAPPGTPAAAGGGDGKIASSIDEAMRMVGLHEVKDQQVLKEYMRTGGRSLSGEQNAWCAAFVNAMVEHAGGTGTHSWAAKSFLKWGRAVSGKEELQKGDVFVFNRGRDPAKGHVGAFTGQTRTNARGETEYQIIQGNIGDRVATSWKTRAQIPYVRRGEFGDTQLATQSKSIQPTQKVEVNGSAKVNIDVKAPAGTKAKANGSGLLKDINLKRTTQMNPADAAPPAPMQE
jgi:uncharacterized protein (TIGR02594 family)